MFKISYSRISIDKPMSGRKVYGIVIRSFFAVFTLITVVYTSSLNAGPLHDASDKGDLTEVKQLIEKGMDVNAKGEHGRTPLHEAALKGHFDVVELLISKGAEVDAKDKLGRTPLHWATFGGHLDIVEILISKGAKVNIEDKLGRTPLHEAISGWYYHNGNIATEKYKQLIELLISKGADINKIDANGRTPMIDAARKGLLSAIEILINKGAEVKTTNGFTPLHTAALMGAFRLAELLISKGANVDASDYFDFTPLHLAALGGYTELVELLISKGANVNAMTFEGQTMPINLAFSGGHKEVVELLKQHGAKYQQQEFMTAKDIETMNKGVFEKRAFHIKGTDTKVFLALDPSFIEDEYVFFLLKEQDIDEIIVWKFMRPTGIVVAMPFRKGCIVEGYGEPDILEKINLMHEVLVLIGKYGIEHQLVREGMRKLYTQSIHRDTTPELLEMQVEKMINRVRALL